ncbi:TrkH family potassium uptake protein [Actinotalea sp. K2]|uniref:TrkH family potassium uptake protein n=1 Tax=Actinotalea sp. K2 TaxID=2939438 RepID=UPI002016E028|nr:TrkH family potassium uptake protein [Actinotalea sp. K2]MCL3861086.1 TrkH family potassium uptake protein [Actinotalea sp. K2]
MSRPFAASAAPSESSWLTRTVTGRLPDLQGRPDRGFARRPGLVIVAGFAGAVLVATLLLLLPAASAERPATVLEALFTATSAVCVTGLVVVDTATHWTGVGQALILLFIQVGGLGIMTLATLLGLLISRRLGLQSRRVAAASTRSVGMGDVRTVLFGVARATLIVEGATALVLTMRFAAGYDMPMGRALWHGVFHSVSAFNNAGFALYSDSLIPFATDPWVSLPIAIAVILGGLGFPVLLELHRQHRRPKRWSIHTKITVLMTLILLVGGWVFMLATEWNNPSTLGALDTPGKLLAGFFQGVMPRTAGFNSLDTAAMSDGTLLGTVVLMFIGGAPAGTAGGIKVTTFAVLLVVIWSELRGDPDATIFDRRMTPAIQRQALSVALLSVATVIVATMVITTTSEFGVNETLFEVVSAFATVGLSTGITDDLAPPHQLLLVILMFIGRLGPVTLGAALAVRERQRLFRMPEGAPIVG